MTVKRKIKGTWREGERGRDIMSDNQKAKAKCLLWWRDAEEKWEAVPVSIICCFICMGPSRTPRERGMDQPKRGGRSEMFSSGHEAGCEYLIDSRQSSGGFTVLCCRTQTPWGKPSAQTRAMEHEHREPLWCKQSWGSTEEGEDKWPRPSLVPKQHIQLYSIQPLSLGWSHRLPDFFFS